VRRAHLAEGCTLGSHCILRRVAASQPAAPCQAAGPRGSLSMSEATSFPLSAPEARGIRSGAILDFVDAVECEPHVS